MKNLIIRTITGAIFIASIIFSAIYSPPAFAILFLVMALIGLWEFLHLAKQDISAFDLLPAMLMGIAVYAIFPLYSLSYCNGSIFLVIIPILLLLTFYYMIRKGKDKSKLIFGATGGIVLVVIPLALLNLYLNPGAHPSFYTPWLVLGMFGIIWTHDTFAYLTGSLFGKHPLYRRISPKKTWEGSIGGFGFAIIAAYIISVLSPVLMLSHWLSFALIITVFGTLGDLAESYLKRKAGVKDSGNILPGHGGILDRFDSVLFVAPIIYLLILIYTS